MPAARHSRTASNATHHSLPLIFLTAEDTDEMRAAAREAGAAGFFRNPMDTQALLDAIAWVIEQPAEPNAVSTLDLPPFDSIKSTIRENPIHSP